MITIDDSGVAVGFGRSIEAKIARLNNLRHADPAARRAALRRLRGVAFRPNHRSSHFLVHNGRVEVGSRIPSYFKLLSIDGEKLGEIYAAWVVTGATSGS
jgi:hypothetical protein